MTDRQILQHFVAVHFGCMICTENGKKLCELHQADERTESARQSNQGPILVIDRGIY